MNFESGHIYHLYNQGNNRQKIFYRKSNYHYFIKKVKKYLSPYVDIAEYCLMPNHFHFLIYVKHEKLRIRDLLLQNSIIERKDDFRTLNNSIGLLLRSYTRAINIQENRSGSLFRRHTKAKCATKFKGPSVNFYTISGVTKIDINKKNYIDVCTEYIRKNPVNAGLVFEAYKWEFSSVYERKYSHFRLLRE